MLSRSYPGAADALATVTSSAVAADTNVEVLQRRAALHAAFADCLSDCVRLCPDVAPGRGGSSPVSPRIRTNSARCAGPAWRGPAMR
jgi:hypothetical protein